MSEIIEKETTKQAIKPPAMWNVILHNDDFTPINFVMECLIIVFKKNEMEANNIAQSVHLSGKGIIGTYTKDVALTKQDEAMALAKAYQHPLLLSVEEN